MSHDDWDRLSEWHNTWLAADPLSRRSLRTELADARPALVGQADALLDGSARLDGFLETPALVLAAQNLAAETVTLGKDERLGPYRIVGLLAHGGMGDVYRATDVRLHRDVALKLLAHPGVPEPGRIERFVQEARVTASLDHPNIVRLFDVGIHRDHPYIVEELLEGETLRSRLGAGLSIADIRRIAAEIARGLVAAHAAGLVHCDLKPENVFLTQAGGVKILDFGIARLAQGPTVADASSTFTGVLLGTAGYLAPEQIRGAMVDARTDLFALGSMLFEALTGERAFGRPNVVETLHAILHDPVPDIASRRADAPPALCAVVERLVEKEPGARFQTASDLTWTLERLDDQSRAGSRAAAPVQAPLKRSHLATIGVAAAALSIPIFGTGLLRAPAANAVDGDAPMARATWTLPAGIELSSAPVVAPDQQRLVFAGAGKDGPRLYIRELGSLNVTDVPGTDGAKQPFWSPDSRAVGFFARGKLFKLALSGGAPVELASAPDARGGAWAPDGTIVFQPLYRDSPLLRISADGGRPAPVTVIDTAAGDVAHRWPALLADGTHVLYQVIGAADERRGVYIADTHAPAPVPGTFLFRAETSALYVPGSPRTRSAGFLLAAMGDHMEAHPFDAVSRTITGDTRRIELAATGAGPHADALVSATAQVLAFSGGRPRWGTHPASIARDGTDLQIWPEPELGGWLRLSPDGRRLSRTIVDTVRSNPDVWVEDLALRTKVRVTRSNAFDVSAVWSADGRRLAFRSGTLLEAQLTIAAADGTGIERTLSCPTPICEPTDWSPDGRALLVNAQQSIWLIPTDGGKGRALVEGSFDARDARFSADGRWIAYVSTESGRPEISLRTVSGDVRRYVLSSGGGDQPAWRGDSGELFYVGPDARLRSVAVRFGPGGGDPSFGTPTLLNVPPIGYRHWGTVYDVSPDGRRIVLPRASDIPGPREVGVVINWLRLLD